jgi:hypothetical protein
MSDQPIIDYQVGGADPPWEESSPLSPMCWATPRVIEVIDPVEKAVIQAFWRPEIPGGSFSRDLNKNLGAQKIGGAA